MMSLFNSFDFVFFHTQVFVLAAIFSLMSYTVYVTSSFNVINNVVSSSLITFFETLKSKMFLKINFILFLSTMFTLFYLNIMSIFPYTFSFTSQLSSVVTLSLTIWVSFILIQVSQNIKGFLIHMVPEGTPIYLTWFLFAIEMVSASIRPITLTVRLVANILAGHLLMILLSKIVFKKGYAIIFYSGLNLVEMFVSLIQSYIFVTMICLYYSDVE